MEFIIDEAEVEEVIYSSDESDVSDNNESDLLSDYSDYEENNESFYRKFDNTEEFHKFKNQIKNPVEERQRKHQIIMETMICLKCFCLKIQVMLNLTILNALRKEQIILEKLSSVLTINRESLFLFCGLWSYVSKNKKQT